MFLPEGVQIYQHITCDPLRDNPAHPAKLIFCMRQL